MREWSWSWYSARHITLEMRDGEKRLAIEINARDFDTESTDTMDFIVEALNQAEKMKEGKFATGETHVADRFTFISGCTSFRPFENGVEARRWRLYQDRKAELDE